LLGRAPKASLERLAQTDGRNEGNFPEGSSGQLQRLVGDVDEVDSNEPAPSKRSGDDRNLLAASTTELHDVRRIRHRLHHLRSEPFEELVFGARDGILGQVANRLEEMRPQGVVKVFRRQLLGRLL
jgi:hypothetical protein